MKNSKPAFTLIELLIVIVIIIILTGIGIPLSVGYISERQIYNAAAQIQQDLLLVQNKAITYSAGKDSGKFEIYFYPSTNTYYFEDNENASFISPSSMSGKIVTRQFSSAFKIENVSEGWHIAFDNQGLPYPNGATSPSGATITVSIGNGSKKLNVVISPIGRVTIEKTP
jgi:prepilin-type N-terminal cleavage/methylation domain-containing protein